MRSAQRALVFGATGDIGGSVIRCAPGSGVDVVAAPRTLPVLEELPQIITNVDAIINCVGLTRPTADQYANRRDTYLINVLFPAHLTREADRQDKPAIHLSTWVEGLDIPRLPSAIVEELHDPELTSSCRLDERLKAAWQQAEREPLSQYLLSKLLLEEVVARSKRSVAVRVSNVYGPELLRHGLLPRLIQARIHGSSLTCPDEPRNYSTGNELGRFLLACAIRSDALPGQLIDGFGSANTTVRELARAVERSLPTCYGQLIVTGNRQAPQHEPSLPRYFPDLLCPVAELSEIVHRTARRWRRRAASLTADAIGDSRGTSGNCDHLSGGSIARKRVVMSTASVPYVEKQSSVGGYEGAAAPKLAAETMFYTWLTNDAPADLYALFAEPILDRSSGIDSTVATVYVAKGRTIADAIPSFPRPRNAMRAIVTDLYANSYFRDLEVLTRAERLFLLSVLYLDRAADRLRSFLEFAAKNDGSAPSHVIALVEALLGGEHFEVDGEPVENPLVGLERLAEASTTERLAYAPAHAGTCGHGDLTILNILWSPDTNEARLIDPRGVVGPFDPIYDLGKLLFSLSGFGLLMRGGIQWETTSARQHRLVPTDPRLLTVCANEHAATLEWLCVADTFAPLRVDDTNFRLQLLLAEATHYLADVPYRYAQGRDWVRTIVALLIGSKRLSDLRQAVNTLT